MSNEVSIASPDGVITRDYTTEEAAQVEKDKTAEADYIAKKYDYKKKMKTDRDAGNAKLLSLGLTQDQVTALTGYDPNINK